MSLIEDYNDAKRKLYEDVQFEEDWTVYAINDHTDMFWKIMESENVVRFAESIDTLESDGDYYEYEIFEHRHYPKAVWEGKAYTMIISDTHVDGNRFFTFFDNGRSVI